jgi:peptidoglycan/xylan/chitin deacetylase (PgdA/CDA1 family)
MYLVQPTYLIKSIYPKAIWRKEPTEKKLYLTFDDGPIPEITTWVLDVLKQYNVKATFFCVGNNVEKHPTIFQRLLDEQHAVGNHTYNHLNGWKTHSPLYLKNVSKCKELVNSRLFRPPYGKMKKTQFNVLRRYYSIVLWDVLSGDYDKKTSPEKCLKNVLDKYRNGSIIVFHDNIKAWTNLQFALPKFIEHALKEGYRFETL